MCGVIAANVCLMGWTFGCCMLLLGKTAFKGPHIIWKDCERLDGRGTSRDRCVQLKEFSSSESTTRQHEHLNTSAPGKEKARTREDKHKEFIIGSSFMKTGKWQARTNKFM